MTDDGKNPALEVQVAVHAQRINDLEEEQLRHRQRLHDLEGLRATVQLVTQRLDQLAMQVAGAVAQTADISRDVKQILLAMAKGEGRVEGVSQERTRWLDSRRFVITTIVTLVVGLAAAVATIVWLKAGG
jgi:chromosome segregation ATPase